MVTIGKIEEFNDSTDDFDNYIERFELWLTANTIGNDKKIAVFGFLL